jgi:hypothetical protein
MRRRDETIGRDQGREVAAGVPLVITEHDGNSFH